MENGSLTRAAPERSAVKGLFDNQRFRCFDASCDADRTQRWEASWMLFHSRPFRQGKDRQISAGVRDEATKGVVEMQDEHGRSLSSRRVVRAQWFQSQLGGELLS